MKNNNKKEAIGPWQSEYHYYCEYYSVDWFLAAVGYMRKNIKY